MTNTEKKPDMQVSARLLSLCLPFMAKLDIRYYLCGFHVRPHPRGGVLIACTDGHQLGLAYDAEGWADKERILSVLPDLVRHAKGREAHVVHTEGERLVVRDLYGVEKYVQAGRSTIEGKFPDVLKVVPNDPAQLVPGACGNVAAGLLLRVAQAAARAGGRMPGGGSVTHWTKRQDEGGAIVSRFPAEPNFIVVTMPRRDGGDMQPLPFFLKDAAA